jgi:hypothetical protein
MSGWSREAIGARVDHLAREHQGDAFVAAVAEFSRADLDGRERGVLYDVLIERGKRGMLTRATHQRRSDGWMRRMLEGRIGRRPRPLR